MNKRKWTRGEKGLVGVPALLFAAVGLVLWRQVSVPPTIRLPDAETNHPSNDPVVRSLDFSPDGRRLVVVYWNNSSNFQNAIFDTRTCVQVGALQFPTAFPDTRLDWSPDGSRIVGAYNMGGGRVKTKAGTTKFNSKFSFNVAMWSAATCNLMWTAPYAPAPQDSAVSQLRFSADGRVIVGEGRPLALLDAATGAQLGLAASHFKSAGWSWLNRDRTLLAQNNGDATQIQVREARTGRVLWNPKVGRAGIFYWSPSDVLAISDFHGTNDRRLLLWDGQTRRPLPAPPTRHAARFIVNPRKSWVAISEITYAGADGQTAQSSSLWVWNYATQKTVWRAPMRGFVFCNWSPNGRYLASAETENAEHEATLRIFDAKGALQRELYEDAVDFLVWAPDSKQLAVAGENQIQIVRVD